MTNNKSQTEKTIGVVGGVGPSAGVDLVQKIFDQTNARTDQDHLNVIMFSYSSQISDRTEYLYGKTEINPGEAIYHIVSGLEKAGANVVGVPCNTFHAKPIWDVVQRKLSENNHSVIMLNMIEETARFIKKNFPGVQRIGLMATNGTVKSNVYNDALQKFGYDVLVPETSMQHQVHDSIYNKEYGIKAQSHPVTEKSVKLLEEAMDHLIEKGAEAIILGCTELPLAIESSSYKNKPLVDATVILARSLVAYAAQHKLKSLS